MKIDLNMMAAEKIFDGTFRRLLDLAALADRKGIDQISNSDHLGFDRATHAERIKTHDFPYSIEQPWLEPIAFLSAVAAVTTRVRLSTFVLVAPLRPALLLAKQLATLDVISEGRVSIGLGAGWQQKEFETAGMPFEKRFGFMEETIRACRELWSHAPARFQGERIRFDDFVSLPFPVQGDRLPVMLGLEPLPANFGRIARVADGWSVNPRHMDSFVDHVRDLRNAFVAEKRDPNRIEIGVQFSPIRANDGSIVWDATAAAAAKAAREGATVGSFLVAQFCRTEGDIEPFLDRLVALKETLASGK